MKKFISYILIGILVFGMVPTVYATGNVTIDTSVPLFQEIKDGGSYTAPKEISIADLSKTSYILLKKEGNATVKFDGETFTGYTEVTKGTDFDCVTYQKVATIATNGTYLLYARDVYDHATEANFTVTGATIPDGGGGGGGGGGAAPATEAVATPTASKSSGTYATGTAITLATKTEGATIYYTLDGTTPTKNSTKYTGEIILGKDMVIKAIAVKSGMDDSTVAIFTYTIGIGGTTPAAVEVSIKENAKEINYIVGYKDHTFRPEKGVTRAETVVMLSRLLDVKGEVQSATFTDIGSFDWAQEAINICASAGIVSGYTDNTFKPSQVITRGEFAGILARILKIDNQPITKENFPDTKNHWANKSMNAMYEKGYLKGFEDGTFGPDNPITRAQAVAIINRIAGIEDATSQSPIFTDVSTEYWAFDAINAAVM